MSNNLTPAQVKARLQQAGFNAPSITKLMGVNPELALVAARAKELYEQSHPGKSFQVEQGFRSKYQQTQIAAKGSAFTNASGKKGHESPHQFGQAFDFHILENGVRQPDNRENDNDYVDVANSMRAAAQQLGYGNKLNYGALGDVHVGHGKTRHNDWGHIEEKRSFWNQWKPGQTVNAPNGGGAREGAGRAQRDDGPCRVTDNAPQQFNLVQQFLKPVQPFKLF